MMSGQQWPWTNLIEPYDNQGDQPFIPDKHMQHGLSANNNNHRRGIIVNN